MDMVLEALKTADMYETFWAEMEDVLFGTRLSKKGKCYYAAGPTLNQHCFKATRQFSFLYLIYLNDTIITI